MSTNGFFSFLNDVSRRNNSLLCVGLDPPLDIPDQGCPPGVTAVIDATADSVVRVQTQQRFLRGARSRRMDALAAAIRHVHAAGRPVILDAKRGDISSTADAYAAACFDVLGADAVTVEPAPGRGQRGKLRRPGRTAACSSSATPRTPAPGTSRSWTSAAGPLYELIAALARAWNTRGNIGLVVGATYPDLLARVRAAAPDMWILLPGVGAQGGDLEASLAAGLDADRSRVLVNVSRAIWQAPEPGEAARDLCRRIQKARSAARPDFRARGRSGAAG